MSFLWRWALFESKHLRAIQRIRMIWSDPWMDLATTRGSHDSPYCTLLPPQRKPLPTGFVFHCVESHEVTLHEWRSLVRTRFDDRELQRRLQGSWIPCLWKDEQLVATCVLRPYPIDGVNLWIIESLVVDPVQRGQGCGRILMREFMTWIWWRFGAFVLGFTWELTLLELLGAYRKGWGKAIAAMQYGWTWRGDGTSCFWRHSVEGVTVTDSGLRDGVGHVVTWPEDKKDICWSCVAKHGGWRTLWCRSTKKPLDTWNWSGEFVVIGFLNANQPDRLPTVWGDREVTVGAQ